MKTNWKDFTVELQYGNVPNSSGKIGTHMATIKARTPEEAIKKAQNWFGGDKFKAYLKSSK